MARPIIYEDHAVDVLRQAVEYIETGQRFALITSVDIKGGSARDIGSLAVVSEHGQMTGYMSNGCIDQDILLQGVTAVQSGDARLLRYGEGSPFLDLTLPCGGSLLLWVDPNPDRSALRAAYDALVQRKTATLSFGPRADASSEPAQDIAIAYQPKVALTLAGRGAIFRATARVAHTIGFEVTGFSPDADDLTAITACCTQPPTHVRSQDQLMSLEMDETSGLLTLFHDHDWEIAFLMAALDTNAGFIGALGSRRTHAARLAHLSVLGVSPIQQQRIKGPIGLVPSLRNADLIAVSALAEIVQVFAQNQQVIVGADSDPQLPLMERKKDYL